MSLTKRIRAWRLRRLELALADVEHHKEFHHYPSHLARLDRKAERLRRRIARLGAAPSPLNESVPDITRNLSWESVQVTKDREAFQEEHNSDFDCPYCRDTGIALAPGFAGSIGCTWPCLDCEVGRRVSAEERRRRNVP